MFTSQENKKWIHLNPRKGLLGLGLGFLLLVIHSYDQLERQGAIILVAFVLIGILEITITQKKLMRVIDVFYVLLVMVSITLSNQYLQNMRSVFDIGLFLILMNVVVLLIVFFFLWMIVGRLEIGLIFTAIITMALGIGNYFVYQFRGNELMPLDLLSIKTAANVVHGYTIHLTPKMLLAISLVLGAIFLGSVFQRDKMTIKAQRLTGLASLLISVALWFVLSPGVNMRSWANMGTKQNGTYANFSILLKDELALLKPKGYSQEAVADLEKTYQNEQASQEGPDVIVIMNESFGDLRVLGDLKTKEAVMPFFDKMKASTLHGYALASVYGGGTANSEFEFLTGDSIAFLPPGATAYQLYVNQPKSSLVSVLKSQGYYTMATHPYLSSGWSREKVYPLLGFDETTFINDYPRNNLIRGFVSDQEMYEYMIAQYEKRRGQKQFLFGVTMQNHGGYTYDGYNKPELKLDGYGDYGDVEQYLGLIRESDLAFEYLITYFSKVDRDVIILMFGDHQANLSSDFLKKLQNGELEGLDQIEKQYKVPFMIYKNYDHQESYVETTSLNYLSTYLYQEAGLSMPAYNKFLIDLMDTIPSINSQGYYSLADKRYKAFQDAKGKEKEMLNRYKILQYNHLFEKNPSLHFFPYNKKAETD